MTRRLWSIHTSHQYDFFGRALLSSTVVRDDNLVLLRWICSVVLLVIHFSHRGPRHRSSSSKRPVLPRTRLRRKRRCPSMQRTMRSWWFQICFVKAENIGLMRGCFSSYVGNFQEYFLIHNKLSLSCCKFRCWNRSLTETTICTYFYFKFCVNRSLRLPSTILKQSKKSSCSKVHFLRFPLARVVNLTTGIFCTPVYTPLQLQ